jgi:hypothetical protein
MFLNCTLVSLSITFCQAMSFDSTRFHLKDMLGGLIATTITIVPCFFLTIL